MLRKILILVCLTGLAVATHSRHDHADFERDPCTGRECPTYGVVCSSSEYEVREYAESWWVSTTVRSFSRGYAAYQGAGIIYKYMHGANSDAADIESGWPILVQIRSNVEEAKDAVRNVREGGDIEQQSFSVAIYIPRENWGSMPEPSDERVKIDTIPVTRFFVRNFGGWSSGMKTLRSGRYLAQKLKANDEWFDSDWMYHAIYNRPNQVFGRRNEIWFFSPKFTTPACARDPPVDNNIEEETTVWELLERYDNGIEKRSYPGGRCMCYTVSDDVCDEREAMRQAMGGIKKLVQVIRKKKPEFRPKGPLILSVRQRTQPAEGQCDKEFKMMTPSAEAMLGVELPADSRISFLEMGPRTFYAYSFDGYFTQAYRNRKGAFHEALDSLGVCYDNTLSLLSLHNKPSKLFDRENTILHPVSDTCDRRWWKR
ncbi:PREDICTED: uncharacterized protein LOC106812893 [Priapulus caudatus]|uniref:Uncharacterized protein LOC106812893 n=1 Tax=Priapulus caudatus TaxID=37621 RepID=A0ABM1EJK9_PRICU|nr:PREDICTED: uncharacterized protein LOC106812893 [Priapulus caudatus]